VWVCLPIFSHLQFPLARFKVVLEGSSTLGGAAPHLEVNQQPNEGSHSSSDDATNWDIKDDVVISPARFPGQVLAPITLDTITDQLHHVQLNIDIMRNQHNNDQNELVAYINDVQHVENEILNTLESLR